LAARRKRYAFHQGEVRRDPNLLEWVLRENHWDYASGWLGKLFEIADAVADHADDVSLGRGLVIGSGSNYGLCDRSP
jgi:hypothetical protein